MREVKNRVQAGWSRWRQVSRVIGDGRTAARMKGKIYETVVRPKMYGLETGGRAGCGRVENVKILVRSEQKM